MLERKNKKKNKLMTKLNKILDELQLVLAEELLDKLKAGKARASDYNVARQMLKDNSYEVPPIPEDPLRKLTEQLPFNEEDKVN